MLAAIFALAATLGPAPALAANPVRAGADDPAIRVSLNNGGRFQRGDKAKVQVRVREDGYLIVVHVDSDRRLRVLFPLDPHDDNFVRGGQKYDIRGRGGREAFRVDGRSGSGAVYAAISRDPFRFTNYEVGDHWDFSALNDVRLGDDVEADLNDFARQIAIHDFDYDLQHYDVYESVAYAGTTYATDDYYGPGSGSSYWNSYYDDGCFGYWGCGYNGGTRVSIGIGLGRPWYGYPYSYDPWYYGPGYWPPRYYTPAYYNPYYYYPRYRVPYRRRFPAGNAFAYDHYHGGYYTSPSRARDPRGFSTYGGGNGTFGGGYVPGRLASGAAGNGGWRSRGVTPVPVRGTGSTYVPPRRTADPLPVDMTPGRNDGRRSGPAVVAAPTGRQPEARPADGRREPRRDANDQGRRNGPATEPRRQVQESAPVRINPPARDRYELDGGAPVPRGRGAVDGFEMPRVIDPRTPERHPVEARPSEPRDVRMAEPRESAPRRDEPRREEPRRDERPTPPPSPRDMGGGDRGRPPEVRANPERAREAPREAPRERQSGPREAPRERQSGPREGGGGSHRPSSRR